MPEWLDKPGCFGNQERWLHQVFVDFQKVNQVTGQDAYPLPRTDYTLDVRRGRQYFSTLDLYS